MWMGQIQTAFRLHLLVCLLETLDLSSPELHVHSMSLLVEMQYKTDSVDQ